jgi:hypothetical protein
MDYQGYQFSGKDITSEISFKVKEFIKKYGYPPEVLEFGSVMPVLPEGLSIVTKVVKLPKNIMLMGMEEVKEVEDDSSNPNLSA